MIGGEREDFRADDLIGGAGHKRAILHHGYTMADKAESGLVFAVIVSSSWDSIYTLQRSIRNRLKI
ncbi:MAG: hypothetical protein J0I90_09805 [Nitrosospira sp.]|nr:hypothetical protein [Nitrosospira sp.]